jgi:protein O-GlcNAc transferase
MATNVLYLQAETLFKQNRLAEARATADRCLVLDTTHKQANFLLGLIDRKQGRHDAALKRFTTAATADPKLPDPHLLVGMTLHDLGQTAGAIQAIRRCIGLDPNRAQAWAQLGRVFLETGDFKSAESPLRRAVELDPRSLPQRLWLGDALRGVGSLEQAVRIYREAASIDPSSLDAASRLGAALAQLGRYPEAEVLLRKTIALNPRQATALYNLSKILIDTDRLDEAAVHLESAVQSRPGYAEAISLLGNLVGRAGRMPEAIALQRQSVRLKPDAGVASNLLLSLNYLELPPADVFAAHKEWAVKFGPPNAGAGSPRSRPPSDASATRLRIGYLSPNFSAHSVAYFIEPVLAAHDRSRFEIFCYADVAKPDTTTARLQSLAEHWHPTAGLSTAQVVDQIKADRIDMLIDLAGHTSDNRMPVFAAAPAPVQMSYLGYPNTTGLPTIDYRVTDAIADPDGTEQFHTEKLIRIPGGMWAYKPPADAPPVSALPAIANGLITFGSFNNMPKVTPAVLASWAQILTQIPTSRLKIKSRGLAGTWGRDYVMQNLTAAGVDPARIDLINWTATTAEHLAIYNQIDIALDTFPYNGTTTTCEALWMGVPVVTFTGSTSAGRVGASLLNRLEMTDWTAADAADYVHLAISKALEVDSLQKLRGSLRARIEHSPLSDGRRVAAALEEAFTAGIAP